MDFRVGRTWTVLFAIALYGGPVLAGLAGHGWKVLPVFAAFFLIFVVATRKPDLSTGAGWAGLAIMAVVQIVLATGAWGLGILASDMLAALVLPLWAPVAITGAAAGLGAWAWRDAAEMNVMLDSAIQAIEAMERTAPTPGEDPWPEPSQAALLSYERLRRDLAQLAELDPDSVDPLVRRFEADAGLEGFDLLYDDAALEGEEHDPRVDYALMRFLALPGVLDGLIARGEAGMGPVLLLNSSDARVRAEARARARDLVAAGAPLEQLPDHDWLAELAREFPEECYDTLLDTRAANTGA